MGTEAIQRQLLAALLECHPRMVSIEELRGLVNERDIDEALDGMIRDGLVTRLGDLLSASWVAVRASRLQAP